MRDRIIASLGRLDPERSVPSNGNRPQSRAKSITPIDQTSRGGPAFDVPLKTSGARKESVPQLDFIIVPGLDSVMFLHK